MTVGFEVTRDRFLDGKLQVSQPLLGYRAATDPVFLAAAVPAKLGNTVLELGCGVGVASLCLGARVAGVELVGLEVQPEYAALARENARENGIGLEVVDGDLQTMPKVLRARVFDHVMANPPFFEAQNVKAPGNEGKMIAHMDQIGMGAWVQAGLRRLKPGGTITIIQKAEQLPAILDPLCKSAGSVRILPLAAREGHPAKRVIVHAKKGSKGGLQLLAPFIVHSGSAHVQGQADFGQKARGILRDGQALLDIL